MYRMSVLMLQPVLVARGDPDAVCRVIRIACGLLAVLVAGVGTWLPFSRS